jgi:dihydroorotate dehydrogenase electron transfer subunit
LPDHGIDAGFSFDRALACTADGLILGEKGIFMIQVTSEVVSNKRMAENCWRVVLDCPQISSEVKPGQFIHVKTGGQSSPLFRRPFSVFRRVPLKGNRLGIEIVYKVIGTGTRVMTGLRRGDTLDIIGPLGHGFELNHSKSAQVVVAGGTGAACLFLLADEISKAGLQLMVLLGAETKASVLLRKEYATLKGEVRVSTDDGTYGFHGFVTQMLDKALDEGKISTDCVIYSSGPEPMLKALAPICQKYHIPAQVSVERHMMCGIGACLACVCKVDPNHISKNRDLESSHIQFVSDKEFGYALVCKDGPVFDMNEVIFDD